MAVEDSVQEIFNKVLDVKAEEIQPDAKIEQAYGVDSTEMVEISVGLKKQLGIELTDNELKKTHSFNEIVEILKSKGGVMSLTRLKDGGHVCRVVPSKHADAHRTKEMTVNIQVYKGRAEIILKPFRGKCPVTVSLDKIYDRAVREAIL